MKTRPVSVIMPPAIAASSVAMIPAPRWGKSFSPSCCSSSLEERSSSGSSQEKNSAHASSASGRLQTLRCRSRRRFSRHSVRAL
ncbi:hypothetical protein ABH931_006868 [Streptacidiphilus sp. MAP12-33]